MPKVNVKWQGKQLQVDVNQELEPLVFKSQLFELTNVLPERQKIMFKGKTIKDDNWDGINLSEGALLMLLGSSEALPEVIKPTADAVVSQSSKKYNDDGKEIVKMPSGLKNLGNTCYMNACLQSFRVIPELIEGIKSWTSSGPSKAQVQVRPFLGSIHTLFNDLASADRESYMPLLQLSLMHQLYPQFATREPQGGYQQQDANELFTELIRQFADSSECEIKVGNEKKKIPVRRCLEGEYHIRMKNLEDVEEQVTESKESFLQLSCFLAAETRYLQSGILTALTEEVEKHSEKLGRNCKYQKETRISRLPANVMIQMVRFFYKEKEQINAKILKDVKFPMVLDTFDFCTPELQAKLKPHRAAYKEYEDKNIELQRVAKLNEGSVEKPKEPEKFLPTSFEDDPGSCNSGFYQLNAVITHKGRASNSGHYIAWVRVKGNAWSCCDDEYSHQVSEDDILRLSGGGDHHTGYILLYGPRPTPILE